MRNRKILLTIMIFAISIFSCSASEYFSSAAKLVFSHNQEGKNYHMGFSKSRQDLPVVDDNATSLSSIDMKYLREKGYFTSDLFYAYLQMFVADKAKLTLTINQFKDSDNNKYTTDVTGKFSDGEEEILKTLKPNDPSFSPVIVDETTVSGLDTTYPRIYNFSLLVAISDSVLNPKIETYTSTLTLSLTVV